MKIMIKKSDIIHALSNIQGLTNKKSGLVITSGILIKTADNCVKFSATDLETGFEGIYPAEIEKHGTVVINSRKFYEIVKDFPVNDIFINGVGNYRIKIGNEKIKYNIAGMDPDDFPEIPVVTDVNFISINSKIFRKMLKKMIIVNAPADEKRAHLTGIYFQSLVENEKKIIRMVSTDGGRLSKVDYDYESSVDSSLIKRGILLPKKSMQQIIKFLGDEKDIQINVENNNFIIKKENEIFIVRLLEGGFPQYEEIIKNKMGHTVCLNKHLFLMMLKRMSILFSDDFKSVVFNFTKDKLFINTTNPNLGESKESMDINFEGDPIEAAFNPEFFIDSLNVMDSENVVITIAGKKQPCFIEENDDSTYLSVIMPMRI